MHDFSRFLFRKTNNGTISPLDVCRMAAFLVQDGRCYVSGRKLVENQRELHHRLPRKDGGKDTFENLIYLDRTIHHMVHTTSLTDFMRMLYEVQLTMQQLHLLNQLRLEAHNEPIVETGGACL